METNDTDKLLKAFFGERKQEIADNGFTQNVMRHLPEQNDYSWVVWLFACIGLALSLFFGFQTGLIQSIFNFFHHISIYYLLGVIFCFPLLSTAFLFLQNDRYRLI